MASYPRIERCCSQAPKRASTTINRAVTAPSRTMALTGSSLLKARATPRVRATQAGSSHREPGMAPRTSKARGVATTIRSKSLSKLRLRHLKKNAARDRPTKIMIMAINPLIKGERSL